MKCNLCGRNIDGYGNNPYPLIENEDDRCCDLCNEKYVITARMVLLHHIPMNVKDAIRNIRSREDYYDE